MIPPNVREEVATSVYSPSFLTMPLDEDLSNPAPNISKYNVIDDNIFSAQDNSHLITLDAIALPDA